MGRNDHCSTCRRPLGGPDRGCPRCDRPPITEETLDRAIALARSFAEEHAHDPWLRSAGLLAYSLRSQRRGFLDDCNQPFTRAALELLWELVTLGAESGISPLAETAIREGMEKSQPVLASSVQQLLNRHRDALASPGNEFGSWHARL
jgi:hypothetical protein